MKPHCDTIPQAFPRERPRQVRCRGLGEGTRSHGTRSPSPGSLLAQGGLARLPGWNRSHLCLSASQAEHKPHPLSSPRQEYQGLWKVTVSKQLEKAKGSWREAMGRVTVSVPGGRRTLNKQNLWAIVAIPCK